MRVAIAGFQHETNTFAPIQAGLEAFQAAGAWPGLTRWASVLTDMPGRNIPIAGFIGAGRERDWNLLPILWCSAEPAAHVTDQAFEVISAMMLEGLRDAAPYDAVYLDLHGAMVTESYEDGEGELLRRVRALIGPDLPLVVSLDLHANVTEQIVEASDALAIFRTYPHLDMAETGRHAADLLDRIFAKGKPAKALRKASFLTPLQAQYTEMAPNDALYGMLAQQGPAVWRCDLAAGFPPADIRECGPAVVAYGDDQAAADAAAETVMAAFEAAEEAFDTALHAPEAAVRQAMESNAAKPYVLADVQDNPGAGATSDSTGLLHALVATGARGAVLAMLHDPDVAALAHDAGRGGSFSSALGGKLGGPGDVPFEGRFQVEALSDGVFDFTGEMYRGSTASLGPTALLRVLDGDGDVRVVVGSHRCQCLDQAVFTHLGVDLAAARIVAVKSTVHFRADFEPIAEVVLPVVADGAHPCRLDELAYENLRAGVRLGPLGPVHNGSGQST
nr:M81 family metallopeptidase [uncultured Brevundimonas sp.]